MTLVVLILGLALMSYNLFDVLTLRADALGGELEPRFQRLMLVVGGLDALYLMMVVIVLVQPRDVVLFVVALVLAAVAGLVYYLLRFVRELLPAEA